MMIFSPILSDDSAVIRHRRSSRRDIERFIFQDAQKIYFARLTARAYTSPPPRFVTLRACYARTGSLGFTAAPTITKLLVLTVSRP